MVEMFACFDKPHYGMENLKFNYTKNSDFVELLRNITKNSQKPWFDKRIAKWNQHENPPHSEILTAEGIGFTFNLNNNLLYFDT